MCFLATFTCSLGNVCSNPEPILLLLLLGGWESPWHPVKFFGSTIYYGVEWTRGQPLWSPNHQIIIGDSCCHPRACLKSFQGCNQLWKDQQCWPQRDISWQIPDRCECKGGGWGFAEVMVLVGGQMRWLPESELLAFFFQSLSSGTACCCQAGGEVAMPVNSTKSHTHTVIPGSTI